MPHLPSVSIVENATSQSNSTPKLVDIVDNKFNTKLYVVYSKKSISQPDTVTNRGFVAGYYKEGLPDNLASIPVSHVDAIQLMGNWQQRDSKLLSTTLSFFYAVFEAHRRYAKEREEDVRVAIITASTVAPHALTGLECLKLPKPHDTPHDTMGAKFRKLTNCTNAKCEVLVKGQIPSDAIEAIIPITDLLSILPSFWNPLPFQYDGFSMIRNSDRRLREVAYQTSGTDSKLCQRKEAGVKLALDILRLPINRTSRNVTDEESDAYIEKASNLAFDLAHVPCSPAEAAELAAILRPEDVTKKIRETLASIRATHTRPVTARQRVIGSIDELTTKVVGLKIGGQN